MSIKRIVIILLLTIIFGSGLIYYLGTRCSRCAPPDAAFSRNLNDILEEAEKKFSINKNYFGLCMDPEVSRRMSQLASELNWFIFKGKINSTLEEVGGPRLVSCHIAQDGKSWVISAALIKHKGNSRCVDSTGASKEINGYLTANATMCP